MSEWKIPEESEAVRALRHEYKRELWQEYRQRRESGKYEPFKPDMMYICQVCFAHSAEWPREKKHTFCLLWWHPTVTYVTPMVCTNCRMMRHEETHRLGDGRRRFWKRLIALWLGEPYPSMGPVMGRLMRYRCRYWRHSCVC